MTLALKPLRSAYTLTAMSLLSELKRRKVFHVAVVYAAAAWVLVQVVALIEEPLRLPDAFDTATIVLVTLGFPLALILSWLFDWTHDGIVREKRVTTDAADTAQAAIGHAPGNDRSLRDVLEAGPVSISRALALGVRVADALAAAHGNGVVHGNLNPANVMILADGEVKLLGFGQPGTDGGDASSKSGYVAPEQARGESIDTRSDQFSLGAVLYELVTGARAFSRDTEAETLAAVIGSDPEPITRLNPEAPMPLQWAIERCTSKSPHDRHASMRDLRNALASIAETLKLAGSVRATTVHNLPAQRTPMIGRDRELQEIKHRVFEGKSRLLTLTGAGGIGKTRLLIELGRQLLEDFKGGVFFTPLDRIADAGLVPWEIAKSMNVQQARDTPDPDFLQSHVRQHCAAPTLLLVDNFEHVLDAAGFLAELLAASEQLKIVVTSRAALRVYGEREYRVSPLEVPSSGSRSGDLAKSPAIRLFLDRAPQSADFDDEALAIVAEICERLDGLPLAIELAAARTKVLPLPDLLERIRDPLRLLSGGPRDLPARQQTLRATLDWSYHLLDDNHRKLFRRLGVFVGGATLEAIEAVCDVDDDLDIDLTEGIESLVDNSLLRQTDTEAPEPRFTMLDTMREYVLDQLAQTGEEAHIERAHAAYFIVLAEESARIGAEKQREALYERFELELGNLRAAFDRLTAAGNSDWGLRLANSLGHYLLTTGRASEGYERMSRLLSIHRSRMEDELLVWSLCGAAELAINSARHDEALRLHIEGLELARKRNLIPAILRALNALAVQLQQAGELDRARECYEEAIEIARDRGGSKGLIGSMLSNYADHALLRGDYELAQRSHEEAAELFIEDGNEPALAWSLNHQGDVARRRGDLDGARRLYEDSLAKFKSLPDRSGMAACLYDLAAVAVDRDDFDEGERLNKEALALNRELGHRANVPRVLEALAHCAIGAGNAKRALTLAGSAEAMRRSLSLDKQEAMREALDRDLDIARQLISGSEAATCWMSGWSMPPDQAIDFALAGRE